jgi:hypothetical protein
VTQSRSTGIRLAVSVFGKRLSEAQKRVSCVQYGESSESLKRYTEMSDDTAVRLSESSSVV